MTEAEVLSLFRRSGALLEGHFLLSSGLHSPGYLQCALVLQFPRDAEALGAALGAAVRSVSATAVLSPALGGIVIGQEVARALGVRAVFAERQDGTLTPAPRLRAGTRRSRARRRRRGDHGRLDPRNDAGGPRRRRPRRRRVRDRGPQRRDARSSTSRFARSSCATCRPMKRRTVRSARKAVPVVKPGSRGK